MFTVSLQTDSSTSAIIKHVDETVYKLRRDPSMTVYQGTIAAAAVINEIIAVFMAKKGFEWAGELHQAEGGSIHHDTKGKAGTQPA